MNVQQINGKVVAITGGARGIGLATSKALVARGAKVGSGDLDHDLLQEEFSKLGGTTATFPLDVTDRESFAAFLDGVEAQLGPIDVLVNNAGIMALGEFLAEDDATADRLFDVNVKSVLLGHKLAVPRMIERGDGHVVTLVSGVARVALPGAVTYSASKFAVWGMLQGLAAELRKQPVALTGVFPAIVQTDLTSGLTGKTRGVKTLVPEDVAGAVVEAIEKRPFEMYVPKSMKATFYFGDMMPRAMGTAIARVTNADRVLTQVDRTRRLEYEQKHQLGAGNAPKQIQSESNGKQ